MYVNISHCDIICPNCHHLNFSKDTIKQLLLRLKKIKFEEDETKTVNFNIVCDQCKQKFEIKLSILKHRLIYIAD